MPDLRNSDHETVVAELKRVQCTLDAMIMEMRVTNLHLSQMTGEEFTTHDVDTQIGRD